MFLRVILPFLLVHGLVMSMIWFLDSLDGNIWDILSWGSGVFINICGLIIWVLYINVKYERESLNWDARQFDKFRESQMILINRNYREIITQWADLETQAEKLREKYERT